MLNYISPNVSIDEIEYLLSNFPFHIFRIVPTR